MDSRVLKLFLAILFDGVMVTKIYASHVLKGGSLKGSSFCFSYTVSLSLILLNPFGPERPSENNQPLSCVSKRSDKHSLS